MRLIKKVAWTNNEEELAHCSSGGVFFTMAQEILSQGGKVFGVIWQNWEAKYVLTKDIEVVKQMRGSKYVASNLQPDLQELKREKGRVLVVALPCQMEIIKTVCNTTNFILCALLCHGTPTNKTFQKHLNTISKGEQITNIQFRDKRCGWNLTTAQFLRVEFANGTIYDKRDEYVRQFLQRTNLKSTCSTCRIGKTYHRADILIGDAWLAHPRMVNPNGTSVVLLFTPKGRDFFLSLKNITVKKYRISLKKLCWRRISDLLFNRLKPLLRWA